jgi:hypothetical protein
MSCLSKKISLAHTSATIVSNFPCRKYTMVWNIHSGAHGHFVLTKYQSYFATSFAQMAVIMTGLLNAINIWRYTEKYIHSIHVQYRCVGVYMVNKCIYLYRYICVGSDGVHNKFCLCFWSCKIVLFALSFSVINRNGEIYILAVDFVKKKSFKSCKIRFYCKYPHVWQHKITQDQVIEDSSYKTTARFYRSFFTGSTKQ